MRKTLFSLMAALGLAAAVPAYSVNLSEPQRDYPDFTYAAETAVEAVVYVEVTVTQTYQRPQIDDPFFRFFFGDELGQPQSRERKGSGSGVIIRPDGYIVTNNHVVSQATKVRVTLNNNRSYDATVIGTDPATDVALIKIDATGLPALTFADSDKLRLGEWVLAIGSPYDLRSTITAGIVSAKGRSMPNYTGEFKIESFIQTDAAVNPGNSGGALVNKKGELVGVNTAIISQTGSYTGYSFAVPSNIVKKTVADLMDFGTVRRAKLGVMMKPVDEKIAEEMKLSTLEGVYIVEVSKGGAAEKAGIKEGDIILTVDGKTVTSTSSLQTIVNGYHPGDVAQVSFVRSGKKHTVKVTFTSDSETTPKALEDGTVLFYGAKLKAADSKTLSALRIKSGVEVVSVGNGQLAAAGVQDGLIIRFVNDQPVSKPQDVVDQAGKAGRVVVIEGVTPAGRSVFFALPKEQ
ncbi:MAG: Do family serine endopeptidase [Bacteroidales bacterium]|nr:Do family serine endopeptidase [Bacteroidales bacterium]